MTLVNCHIFKGQDSLLPSKRIFKVSLNVSYVLGLLIHDTCSWSNINIDKLLKTVLKRSRDVSKTISFFK